MARVVGDLQDRPQPGERGQHLRQGRCEHAVHHDRSGGGVVQQVPELVGDVAVVHVERRHPGLERAEHRLEVLVAVVQVHADVVLAALPVLQLGSFDMASEALRLEVVRQPAGPVGHVVPGQAAVPEHQALVVRARRRDRLVHGPHGETHRPEPRDGRARATNRVNAPGGSTRRWRAARSSRSCRCTPARGPTRRSPSRLRTTPRPRPRRRRRPRTTFRRQSPRS